MTSAPVSNEEPPPTKHILLLILQIIIYGLVNFLMIGYLMFGMNLYLPIQIIQLFGDQYKGIALGLITSIGAIGGTVMAPISAHICDKLSLPRIPFIISGMLVFCICTLLRCILYSESQIVNILLIVSMVLFSKLSYAVAYPLFSALLVDHFPKSMYSIISAVFGFAALMSSIYGTVIPGLIIHKVNVLWIILGYILITCIGMVLLFVAFPEFKKYKCCSSTKQTKQDTISSKRFGSSLVEFFKSIARPFLHWNFTWLFIGRFALMLAIGFSSSFQLYFLRDVIGHSKHKFSCIFFSVTTAEEANSIQSTVTLISSAFGVILSIFLGHAFGKKEVVFLSSVLLGICNIFNISLLNFNWTIILQTIYGFCMGVYLAVDLALINQNLPNKNEVAKDLSLFSVAFNTPQIIAGPIGGVMLQIGNEIAKNLHFVFPFKYLGYHLLFLSTATLQIIGGICVLCLRPNSKQKDIPIVEEENYHTIN